MTAALAANYNLPMASKALQQHLHDHVHHLAGEIGERNVFTEGSLDAAAHYIRGRFEEAGYEAAAQPVEAMGVTSHNLEATLAGSDPDAGVILLGAHYDTVPGSPGADDNASAVAALLELARSLRAASPRHTLRFVAFTNEEPPFFTTGDQGSMVYARAARVRGDDIRLMLSLEMLGFYRDQPGSQQYPPLFKWFHPDRGDFIALVSNFRSRQRMRRFARAFRRASDFPLEHTATFASVPGVGWSDHRSFWEAGYPAVMVTDTAFFRNPYYHTPADTPDKLDYSRLAAVTEALSGAVLGFTDNRE